MVVVEVVVVVAVVAAVLVKVELVEKRVVVGAKKLLKVLLNFI